MHRVREADQDGPVRRVASAFLTVALLGGCGVQGLAFKQDDRVQFSSPGDRAEVDAPVTFRWSARDLPAGTTFAVFVDRSPQPPGKTIRWLFRDDDSCKDVPGCPDAEFLAIRDIYVTKKPSITIERLRERSDGRRRQLHEVTVVLLDENGRRIGESAFTREVQVLVEGDD